MKKILALLLTFTLLTAAVPMMNLAAAAEGEYEIVFYPSDMTYVSGDSVVSDLTMLHMNGASSSPQSAFIKFDFTGYENLLAAANSITFSVWAEANNLTSITVSSLPLGMKGWESSTLTYATANDQGYISSGTAIGTINGLYEYDVTTADITENVKEALSGGNSLSDNVLALRLDVPSDASASIYGQPAEIDPEWDTRPTLTLTFPASAGDSIEALKASYSALSLGDISNVTSDLPLITTDSNNVDISWESADETLIETDGTVNRKSPRTLVAGQYDTSGTLIAGDNSGASSRSEIIVKDNVLVNKPAGTFTSIDGAGMRFREPESSSTVLTATISKDGYSMVKSFSAVVPTESVFITCDDTFIRYGSTNAGPTSNELILDPPTDKSNMRYALLKFNTSSVPDVLKNAKKVELFFRVGALSDDSALTVYNLSGTGTKDWSETSGNNAYTDVNSFNSSSSTDCSVIPAGTAAQNAEYRVDVTTYAKLQSDGILAFKIVQTSGSSIAKILPKEHSNALVRPQLIITPKAEGDPEDDFDKVSAVYESLDLGDTSKVVNDLSLPTSGEGNYSDVSISWVSNNVKLISNEGEVTVPKISFDSTKDKFPELTSGTAILKATVFKGDISVTKEFKVTVPPIGVSIATNTAYVRYTQQDTNYTASGNTLVIDSAAQFYSDDKVNKRHAYIGFDLGTQRELFKRAEKVYLRIYSKTPSASLDMIVEGITAGNGLKGTWTDDEITWRNASDLIAYDAPDKYTFKVSGATTSDVHLIDVTNYIRDLENSTADFKLYPDSTETDTHQFYGLHTNTSAPKTFPALIAVFDEDDTSDFTITANDRDYFYSFPSNNITVKTVVNNSTGKYSDGFKVIYGIYDSESKLIDVVMTPVASVNAADNQKVSEENITLTDKNNSFIKAFVWNNSLVPLNNIISFPN